MSDVPHAGCEGTTCVGHLSTIQERVLSSLHSMQGRFAATAKFGKVSKYSCGKVKDEKILIFMLDDGRFVVYKVGNKPEVIGGREKCAVSASQKFICNSKIHSHGNFCPCDLTLQLKSQRYKSEGDDSITTTISSRHAKMALLPRLRAAVAAPRLTTSLRHKSW